MKNQQCKIKIYSVISLCALLFSLSQYPAFTAPLATGEKPGKTSFNHVSLPSESIGKLTVYVPAPDVEEDKQTGEVRNASGVFTIPAKCKLGIKLNYAGGTNLKTLLNVPGSLVRRLELNKLEIDDLGMATIGKLENLAYLDMSGTDITDGGAVQVARLKNMQVLNLSFLQITGKTIEAVATLPRLTRLFTCNTQMGDGIAPALARMKMMRKLSVVSAGLTDKAMPEIAKLMSLEELQLSRNNITDKSIDQILKLKKLERLNLADTRVTINGLLRLKALPRLKCLLFRLTDFQEDDLKRLKTALPKVILEEGSKAREYDKSIFDSLH